MSSPLPFPVSNALAQLGRDIKTARRRRRISVQLMTERSGVGKDTLRKIEQGAATVSIGGYANVLFVLGLTDKLKNLFADSQDTVGLDLEADRLPKRIRYKKDER